MVPSTPSKVDRPPSARCARSRDSARLARRRVSGANLEALAADGAARATEQIQKRWHDTLGCRQRRRIFGGIGARSHLGSRAARIDDVDANRRVLELLGQGLREVL